MSGADGTLRRIEVAAGIVWQGPDILCCRRPEGKVQAGFWEFPGGKLQPGESAGRALARELAEELGIEVLESLFWTRLVHRYPEHGLEVGLHFFHVTAFAGIPQSREGQTLRWVDYRKAPLLDFLPADRDLIAALTPPQVPIAQAQPAP